LEHKAGSKQLTQHVWIDFCLQSGFTFMFASDNNLLIIFPVSVITHVAVYPMAYQLTTNLSKCNSKQGNTVF